MQLTPVVSLILPAFNERQRILATLKEALAFFESASIPFEIIVAADGEDGTGDLVRRTFQADPRIHVISSKERRGKGKGVQQGVQHAAGKYIGYTDADNKTPITEFARFLPELEKGIEVVIGTRWDHSSQDAHPRKWYRAIGSKVFLTLMQTLLGLREIRDTQCGFKFFSHQAAKTLFSMQTISGYMFDVETLVLARRMGYRIRQIPVSFQDDSDSRLNLLTGNLKNMRDILKIRLKSLG